MKKHCLGRLEQLFYSSLFYLFIFQRELMERLFAVVAQNGFQFTSQIARIVVATKMQIDSTRISWRRRSLVVFVGMAFLILISQKTILSRFHVCLFENFLHIPCPACGVTRSFCFLLNLNITQSLKMCPFGIVLFVILVVYVFYLLIATFTRLFDKTTWSKEICFVNSLDSALVFLLLSNWVYQLTSNH